jgi:hypothetical protein
VKNPEQQARQTIDAALEACGWVVLDYEQMNLAAALGVAVREFPLASGFGREDYALYLSEELVGAVEAKKEGVSFASFETQTEKYSDGVPAELEAPIRPLPFLYQSTGIETHFTNRLDPVPRRRQLFSFHRPETLADWLAKDPVFLPSPATSTSAAPPGPKRTPTAAGAPTSSTKSSRATKPASTSSGSKTKASKPTTSCPLPKSSRPRSSKTCARRSNSSRRSRQTWAAEPNEKI